MVQTGEYLEYVKNLSVETNSGTIINILKEIVSKLETIESRLDVLEGV